MRKLKEGGFDKTVWAPEVAKLVALKSRLSEITGVVPDKKSSSKKGNATTNNAQKVANNMPAKSKKKPVVNNR